MLMKPSMPTRLTSFLKQELAIPDAWIALAQRQNESESLLHIVLWQYGLLTLEQLEQVFDWMETAYSA